MGPATGHYLPAEADTVAPEQHVAAIANGTFGRQFQARFGVSSEHAEAKSPARLGVSSEHAEAKSPARLSVSSQHRSALVPSALPRLCAARYNPVNA